MFRCPWIRVKPNRRPPEDVLGERVELEGGEQRLGVRRRAEQIMQHRQQPARLVERAAPPAPAPRGEGGRVRPDGLEPVRRRPAPEGPAPAVHLDDHEADDVVAEVGVGTDVRQHILDGSQQAAQRTCRRPAHLPGAGAAMPVQGRPLGRGQRRAVVVCRDRPRPRALRGRRLCYRRAHPGTSPTAATSQRSKPARLRATAAVSSTPLRWMYCIVVCRERWPA